MGNGRVHLCSGPGKAGCTTSAPESAAVLLTKQSLFALQAGFVINHSHGRPAAIAFYR